MERSATSAPAAALAQMAGAPLGKGPMNGPGLPQESPRSDLTNSTSDSPTISSRCATTAQDSDPDGSHFEVPDNARSA